MWRRFLDGMIVRDTRHFVSLDEVVLESQTVADPSAQKHVVSKALAEDVSAVATFAQTNTR
jgi:hypothetical protein